MADPKVEALRETLQKYASGELRSDLFEGSSEATPEPGEKPSGSAGAALPNDEYTKARAVVLRKLTGSAKSRHQLEQALQEKDFGQEVIRSVLDRMEDVLLIDDAEFARTWVRTRHEMKGLGSSALRRELYEKGIAKETAEAALDQLSVEDEDAAARELIENKLRGITIPVGNAPEDRAEREKITRRLVGMLGRRGHSPGAAFQLVREAMDVRSA